MADVHRSVKDLDRTTIVYKTYNTKALQKEIKLEQEIKKIINNLKFMNAQLILAKINCTIPLNICKSVF